MCKYHDVEKLKRQADKLRNEYFSRGLAILEKKWRLKRETEERLAKDYEIGKADILTMFQHEPLTAITVRFDNDGRPVVGYGWSMCDGRDEFDPEHGFDVALKKAVRHAARQVAGLEG